MTTASERGDFPGPFSQQLERLANLMNWLSENHKMSFVKAGDDKVYAYGGGGYILVFDESQWQGLIEFITPGGAVTLKPDDTGKISVTGTTQDEGAIKSILEDGISKLKEYYEKRYWSTPEVA